MNLEEAKEYFKDAKKMKEIFRDVINYEGLYKISNLGRVKSLKFNKERILKSGVDSSGYFNIGLRKDGKRKTINIHKLVAESFLGHKPDGYKLVVNHKNFNKLDNRVDNLEIVTQRKNANRKHIKSTSQHVGVSWHKQNKKWVSRIVINGKLKHLGYFDTELEASKAYQNELLNCK